MIPSAHHDRFARDHLPAPEALPEFLIQSPELNYPNRLNCVSEFLDTWIRRGAGDRVALISQSETLTYGALAKRVNRIANVLTRDLGLVPGNRVLLRGYNSPMMVAAWLAVIKAGGVAVSTMPLLRAKEIAYPITKAKISHALCDARLADEMEQAKALAPDLNHLLYWGDNSQGSLEQRMAQPGYDLFAVCDTAADDVCLIAFTSGTTGEPKGTMHFHRDMLATCDTYGRHILRANADDRFIGSPPIAFTFGLGGLVLFPMRIGAAAILIEKSTPDDLLAAIARDGASVLFTAPTAYRGMLSKLDQFDVSSLRTCVSAGEALPKATFDAWRAATKLAILDGIGATEMLHIFIGSPEEDARPGATGRVVPGYEARIVDDQGRELSPGNVGKLAVRGPTGCRYLADARQSNYVQNGWNVTGDTYVMDVDGYFWYQARSDDMIISSGYNIAGPEVEAALLTHPDVLECGVVGAPDSERGQIVKAYIVLRGDAKGDATLARALQDHVKATIAPFKYPRAISFVASLPKTQTGKLQRFALRQMATEDECRKLAS